MSSGDDHDALRRFYNGNCYSGATGQLSPSRHLRRCLAERFIEPSAEPAVLDVACGTGEWLAAARQRGARVAGVDISARAVQIAAEALPEGEILEAVAESLPFPSAAFELVTSLGSLEHIPDKAAALKAIRRLCKLGGQLSTLVPNAGFLTRQLGLFGGTDQVSVREDVPPLVAWEALFVANGLGVRSRWRDLHVLSREWLFRRGWSGLLPRLAQALALAVWPLSWQYQVYYLLQPMQGGE